MVLRAPATSLSSPAQHRRRRLRVRLLAAVLRFIDAPPHLRTRSHTCAARMCLCACVRMWVASSKDTHVWGDFIVMQFTTENICSKSMRDFGAVSEHSKSMKPGALNIHVHTCIHMSRTQRINFDVFHYINNMLPHVAFISAPCPFERTRTTRAIRP